MNNTQNDFLGLFRSKTRTLLLLNFFINPGKKFYIRSLEKQLNIPASNIKKEIDDIYKTGLLEKEEIGNIHLYQIKKTHPLYEPFKQIVMKTVGIPSLLNLTFQKYKEIKNAFVYGSFAKDEFDESSDIDVFVLVNNPKDIYGQISKKISKIEDSLQREINIDIMDLREYSKRKKQKDPYIMDLIKNAKIFVKGGEDEL